MGSKEGKIILNYDPCHLITDKYTMAVVAVYLERLNDLQWLTKAFFTSERVLALLWFANTTYDDGVNNVLLEEIAGIKFSISRVQLSRIRRTVNELQVYDVFSNDRARHHAGSKRVKDEQKCLDEWFDNPQTRCKRCDSATIIDILSDRGLRRKPPQPQVILEEYRVVSTDFEWNSD